MFSKVREPPPFLSSDARFIRTLPRLAIAATRAEWKEWNMYKTLNGVIIVLGLAGASLAIASPACAQGIGISVAGVGVGVGFGNVAYGYQDGYWDRGHRWNNWQNDEEMRTYRSASNNHYNDWKHDRDSDLGWHD
jgi:hypothetical protein